MKECDILRDIAEKKWFVGVVCILTLLLLLHYWSIICGLLGLCFRLIFFTCEHECLVTNCCSLQQACSKVSFSPRRTCCRISFQPLLSHFRTQSGNRYQRVSLLSPPIFSRPFFPFFFFFIKLALLALSASLRFCNPIL